MIGGYRWDTATNTPVYYNTVLRGTILPTGSIAGWSSEPSFQIGRSGLGAARLDNCLFINGGSWLRDDKPVYAADTQYARIGDDGRLSPWKKSSHHLRTPRSNHTLLGITTPQGRFLYAVAGVTQMGEDTVHLDTVEYGKMGNDCQVGPWTVASYHLRGGRSTPQAVALGTDVVVMGGWGDLDLLDVFNDVQVTLARPNGAPSPWQVQPTRLPTGIYGHATTFVDPGTTGNPLLLAVGGQPGTGTYATWIAYAYVQPGIPMPNAIGTWRIAPSGQLPIGRAGHGVVYWRGYLYVIGGSGPNGQFFAEVLSSTVATGQPY